MFKKERKAKLVRSPKTSLFHFHSWKLRYNGGTVKYYTCSCGARKGERFEGNRKRLNIGWIFGETNKLPRQ